MPPDTIAQPDLSSARFLIDGSATLVRGDLRQGRSHRRIAICRN